MCRTMQLEENDISDWLKSPSAPERKLSVGTEGFKMAL